MSADATHATVPGVLTEEEILALAARAKSDAGAVDEMMAALELQLAAMKKAEHRIDGLRRQIDQLQQRLALLLDRMYGRRTEKIDPDQLLLFQEGAPAKIEPEAPAEPPSTGGNARRPSKAGARGSARRSDAAFPARCGRLTELGAARAIGSGPAVRDWLGCRSAGQAPDTRAPAPASGGTGPDSRCRPPFRCPAATSPDPDVGCRLARFVASCRSFSERVTRPLGGAPGSGTRVLGSELGARSGSRPAGPRRAPRPS